MEVTDVEVRRILTEDLGRDLTGIGPGDSLLEAGILDSLAVLELVAAIEQRYGIRVADDEMMPETLGSIAAIQSLLARRQVTPGA
jgi:acyl carrier protein